MIDEIFAMMSTDQDMGPPLRDADVPQRFAFDDLELVVNIRAARDGGGGQPQWEWTDDVDWEPQVRMTMTSQVANKYFQGKENIARAIARRRIMAGGDVQAASALARSSSPSSPATARSSSATTPTWRPSARVR